MLIQLLQPATGTYVWQIIIILFVLFLTILFFSFLRKKRKHKS
jgi:LPXTG-motif cell wall-anchored protein